MRITKSRIKRILIIKLRGIGDVVLSTIVIDNLSNEFPSAQIDYLVEKPSLPVVDGLKNINQVIVLNRSSLSQKIKTVLQLRKNKYDLVFDFYTNPTTALITYFSGARYRAGFPYRGRKYAYNLLGPSERGKYHAAQLHLEFLNRLNICSDSKLLHFNIDSHSLAFADKFIKDNYFDKDFIIGISPTGGWESKKCDPDIFAQFALALKQKYNAKLLLIWGKGDEADTSEIKKLLNENIVTAPETTIREMAALIKKCNILVANDSGPMHISTAVGTPTLSIHGPTSPYMQGPFGEIHEWVRLDELDCIECNLLVCPKKHECFRNLPVERVLSKTDAIIKKNNLAIQIEKS